MYVSIYCCVFVNLKAYLQVSVCVCLCEYRQYTSDYKLETYLKVARLYLEDEDPVQAEAYINRASLLQAESTREDLQIHYKASSDISICCGLCWPCT